MGQYFKPVSLTKREYVDPHKVGANLKLWEQLANHPGTGAALIILTASMPEVRGGGDLDLNENWHGPERKDMSGPGPMPEGYPEIARRTIGRWAGDRIAIVGDYAERDDLPPEDNADLICFLCCTEEKRRRRVDYLRERAAEGYRKGNLDLAEAEKLRNYATRLEQEDLYTDISDDVCRVIEHELHGKFIDGVWEKED